MFTNDKLRLYIFGFLAFCVLSSKNIIIYNEETLVTLSFFCFIFFISHYFGTTIKNSLNERSEIIQQELQNFLHIKENSFKELLTEHQKVSGLVKALKTLNSFTTTELSTLNSNSQKALVNVFIDQIYLKLKTLSLSKLMLQQKLQYLLSDNILSNVLLSYQQTKNENIKIGKTAKAGTTAGAGTLVSQNTIQNAIQLLVNSQKK